MTARWRAASSRSRTAACSSCTPTAWWRTRARTSATGWPGCAASSAPGSPTRPLEDLCKATLDGVYSDHQRDDIAVLIARLRRLPEDHHASWTLDAQADLGAARRVGAGRADEALGPGRPDPDHRAARLRAGHQRGQVLPRRRDAPAGQREGAGLRGAGQLRRRCPGSARPAATTRTAAACRSSGSSPSAGARAAPRPARSSGASSRCRASPARWRTGSRCTRGFTGPARSR